MHLVQQKPMVDALPGKFSPSNANRWLQTAVSFDTEGNRKKLEGRSTRDGTVILRLRHSLAMLIDIRSPASCPTTTQYTYLGVINLKILNGPLEEQTRIHFLLPSDIEPYNPYTDSDSD